MSPFFPSEILALAEDIVKKARFADQTIALSESCTGGLVAAALTAISGSSAVLERGFVVYTNMAKMENLGVPAEILERFTAFSEETARAMVQGTLDHSHADIAFSVTGIAGPGGAMEGKPVGLVHMCVARRNGPCVHERHVFPGERGDVRLAALMRGLQMLQEALR